MWIIIYFFSILLKTKLITIIIMTNKFSQRDQIDRIFYFLLKTINDRLVFQCVSRSIKNWSIVVFAHRRNRQKSDFNLYQTEYENHRWWQTWRDILCIIYYIIIFNIEYLPTPFHWTAIIFHTRFKRVNVSFFFIFVPREE